MFTSLAQDIPFTVNKGIVYQKPKVQNLSLLQYKRGHQTISLITSLL